MLVSFRGLRVQQLAHASVVHSLRQQASTNFGEHNRFVRIVAHWLFFKLSVFFDLQ